MPTETTYDGDPYYVYGLVDMTRYRQTGSVIRSIFYIGKGTKARSEQHEKDELAALKRELAHLGEGASTIPMVHSKRERIRRLLDYGETIPAVTLSSGFLNERDAYRAEALAMELVGRILAAHGEQPLANSVPGHGQSAGMPTRGIPGGVVAETATAASDPEREVDHEPEFDWPLVRSALRASTSRRVDWRKVITVPTILVKGTDLPLEGGTHRQLSNVDLPARLVPFAQRLRVHDAAIEPGTEFVREGYDPDSPWDHRLALERARRYWPIAIDKVVGWLQSPETLPQQLLLAIPGSGGTTVRYAWELDPNGIWEYFPELGRWGIPLGQTVQDHDARGCCLVESRDDGKIQQVLAGCAGGIRILNP